MKTVHEVAKITNISVRTLHYYDQIGLLKPSKVTDTRYRMYDDGALETLRQILFFKELDFSLEDIKSIIHNPKFDRKQVLESQKELLILKRNRFNNLIRLIDDIGKGVNTMSFSEFSTEEIDEIYSEMINNMDESALEKYRSQFGSEEQAKDSFYESIKGKKEEFYKLYGTWDNMAHSKRKQAKAEEVPDLQKKCDELYHSISNSRQEGVNSEQVQAYVRELREVFEILFRMDDANSLLHEMGDYFVKDAAITEANDNIYGQGASVFIGSAMKYLVDMERTE